MTTGRTSEIKKRLTPEAAAIRIHRYCALQERSHTEVRNKLYTFGLYQNEVEELLSQLITGGFLNEERFAKAFAGGKFRIKKWGRNKITHELEQRKITPRCIQKGLNEIDERDYMKTLKALLKKKLSQTVEKNDFKKRHKVAQFAIGKGYEPELVWMILKEADD